MPKPRAKPKSRTMHKHTTLLCKQATRKSSMPMPKTKYGTMIWFTLGMIWFAFGNRRQIIEGDEISDFIPCFDDAYAETTSCLRHIEDLPKARSGLSKGIEDFIVWNLRFQGHHQTRRFHTMPLASSTLRHAYALPKARAMKSMMMLLWNLLAFGMKSSCLMMPKA